MSLKDFKSIKTITALNRLAVIFKRKLYRLRNGEVFMKKIILFLSFLLLINPVRVFALTENEINDTKFEFLTIEDDGYMDAEISSTLFVFGLKNLELFNTLHDEQNETILLVPKHEKLIDAIEESVEKEEDNQEIISSFLLFYEDYEGLPESYRIAMLKHDANIENKEADFEDILFSVKDKKLEYSAFEDNTD